MNGMAVSAGEGTGTIMFTVKKVTQMTAGFVRQAGGRINYVHLMKMLYVADRQMLLKYHVPISYDQWFSMKDGPILSRTLDYIRSRVRSEHWSACFETVGLELVMLKDPGDDELSIAEDHVIADVYQAWGQLKPFEARDRTHSPTEFPEWTDPGSGRIPIGYHEVLRLNHSSPPEIARILDDIETHSELLALAGVN